MAGRISSDPSASSQAQWRKDRNSGRNATATRHEREADHEQTSAEAAGSGRRATALLRTAVAVVVTVATGVAATTAGATAAGAATIAAHVGARAHARAAATAHSGTAAGTGSGSSAAERREHRTVRSTNSGRAVPASGGLAERRGAAAVRSGRHVVERAGVLIRELRGRATVLGQRVDAGNERRRGTRAADDLPLAVVVDREAGVGIADRRHVRRHALRARS